MPEWFATVYIADVNFDNWRGNSRYSIGQRNGGVGECTCVEHDAVGTKTRLVEFVKQSPLVVALEAFEFHAGQTGF